MKKFIAMLTFVIIMISSSITASAGDIPESLMHDENAQLFFGVVVCTGIVGTVIIYKKKRT